MPARRRLRRVPYMRPTRGVKRLSVVVRPYEEFDPKTFRRHDVGRKGFTFRLAGKLKKTGKWATHSFQIPSKELRVVDGQVVGLSVPVRRTLANIERRFGKVSVRNGNDYFPFPIPV